MSALLVGPASIDRYVDTGAQYPGGGSLNMAVHWARLGRDFELVSRISAADVDFFAPFFAANGIRVTDDLAVAGPSCTVDVRFADDRQPWMDDFVEGVWADFEFSADESASVANGAPTHVVLVDAAVRATERLGGVLDDARLTGDFLSFRHMDIDRFDAVFAHLDVGFVGWPGAIDDPTVAELVDAPSRHGNVLVATFGAQGVRVVDRRPDGDGDRWFDVTERPVTGTTVGCGDAFIAAFLAAWHDTADVQAAVDAGRDLGARAVEWQRSLPDDAYPD